MKYGEYELLVPRPPHDAYRARVRLNAEIVERAKDSLEPESPSLLVEFDPNRYWFNSSNFWMGAQFGAAYVWETYPGSFGSRLKVRILEMEGYPGYTSPLLIAYATVFALIQALDWTPFQTPTLNPETGEVIFPRWMVKYENGMPQF